MRIVAENSQQDIDHRQALADASLALKEFAANIMRVTRGAGRSQEIGRQAVEIVATFMKYREVTGYYPSSWEVETALALDHTDGGGNPLSRDEWDWAAHTTVKGALQIAASNLLGQAAQESAGRKELMQGLQAVERIRAAKQLKATLVRSGFKPRTALRLQQGKRK